MSVWPWLHALYIWVHFDLLSLLAGSPHSFCYEINNKIHNTWENEFLKNWKVLNVAKSPVLALLSPVLNLGKEVSLVLLELLNILGGVY